MTPRLSRPGVGERGFYPRCYMDEIKEAFVAWYSDFVIGPFEKYSSARHDVDFSNPQIWFLFVAFKAGYTKGKTNVSEQV